MDTTHEIKAQHSIENDSAKLRKISAQVASTLGLPGYGAACIEAGEDADSEEEIEELLPHFQRVSVSGDDNTGVS